MPSIWGQDQIKRIDNALEFFCTKEKACEMSDSLIQHIGSMPMTTLQEKMAVLSSIPNYHWWGKVSQKRKVHIVFEQHLLHDCSDSNEDGMYFRRYKPTSPRNLLMYYISNENSLSDRSYTHHIHSIVSELLSSDEKVHDLTAPPDFPEDGPAPKRRRQASKRISVTPEALARQYQVPVPSQSKIQHIYTAFHQQLVTFGKITWRLHQTLPTCLDIVVMNDYNPESGQLLPCSFVHVICSTDEDGSKMLTCNCSIYKLMQGVGMNLGEGNGVVDEDFTCMHCRLFKEELQDCFDLFGSEEAVLSKIQGKVKVGLEEVEQPILLLGNVQTTTTTKFSVSGAERHSIVHITFFNGVYNASCQDGMCSVNYRNKKKIPKQLSPAELEKVCSHLRTFFTHFTVVEALYPPGTFEEQEEVPVGQGIEALNLEDEGIEQPQQDPQDGFDVENGLWRYKALSTHRPLDQFNINLIRYENN